jgi:hypothetical protein
MGKENVVMEFYSVMKKNEMMSFAGKIDGTRDHY